MLRCPNTPCAQKLRSLRGTQAGGGLMLGRWLVGCAEVVVFTAGLRDYAQPILDHLHSKYGALNLRLYREATSACPAYPCVKVRRPLSHFQGPCGSEGPVKSVHGYTSNAAVTAFEAAAGFACQPQLLGCGRMEVNHSASVGSSVLQASQGGVGWPCTSACLCPG